MLAEPQQGTCPEYVRKLRNTLTEAYEQVREHVGHQQERQQEIYNKKVHGKPHEPGVLVWLFNPAIPRGRARKFHRPWTGPYRVLTRLSDRNYRLKNVHNHQVKTVHFDRLKPRPANIRLPPPRRTLRSPPPVSSAENDIELVDDDDFPPLAPALARIPPPTSHPPPTPPPPPRHYPSRSRNPVNRYGDVILY